MLRNKLKFNDSKTEFLIIGKKVHLGKVVTESIKVGTADIKASTSARNLGFHFDSNMDMVKQVATVSKACHFYLRNIAAIRKFLSFEDTQTLVHAFISSRLDFCNGLFYGLPSHLIQRIQQIQNTAARIVSHTGKFDHISPVLQSLHWLPVPFRIKFKILITTYKALHGLAPGYISDLIHQYTPARTLRSSSDIQLTVPKTKLVSCGDRAFRSAAPRLWNSLPNDIKLAPSLDVFKRKLKTHFFVQCYG